jgi:hypothetical protein
MAAAIAYLREVQKMTESQCKKRLHDLIFGCGANQRYHQLMASYWGLADKAAKISVAAVAVVALALTFMDHDWKRAEIIWASIAAALAIVLNVVPFGEREKFYDELFHSWSDLRTDAQVFELKVELSDAPAEQHICERLAELIGKEHLIDSREPAPFRRLLIRCQGDENESRWGAGIRTFAQVEQERAKRQPVVNPIVAFAAAEAAEAHRG